MGKNKVKKGKAATSARKGMPDTEPEELVKAPHSFVLNRGRLGKNANELLLNFRKLMEPFTASQLRVQKRNVLKDFIHVAGPLNVSHLVVFTKSPHAMYLRIGKLPHGPTLTFQIKEYSLIRDIISSQKKAVIYEKLFEHHPLLVLNNFSGEGMHFKLMTTTFQNMFPSINVNKTNLNTVRRCLLLNYNDENIIELRHYAIKVVPTGISKPIKKLIQSKVPNLSQYENIDDFLQKSGNLSESEVEMDTPANTVTLPQPISSRGNITSEKSAIRLYEIGPRLNLQLIKIEEGIMSGEVLFHEHIKKSPEEIKALKQKIEAKKLLKEQRKAQQKKNVERKKTLQKSDETNENEAEDNPDDMEDVEWYRKEVGEEPSEGFLSTAAKRKASRKPGNARKKVKTAEDVKHPSINDKSKKKKVRFSENPKFHPKRSAKKHTKNKRRP